MRRHLSLPSLFILTLILLFSGDIHSQVYEASLCAKEGNTALPALIKKGIIPELTWWGSWHLGTYVCDWSTSYLKATGKGPDVPPDTGDDAPDLLNDYEMAHEKWSCMYSAWSAMDGNTATAWCEGKKDEGIGEIIIIKADISRPVRIWSGLGANAGIYKANNRPQKIRVTVMQAREAKMIIGQYAEAIEYKNITVLASHEVELKDINGWQPLPLPAHKRMSFSSVSEHGEPVIKKEDGTLIALEILSVYRGTKYNDTCISEVSNIPDKK